MRLDVVLTSEANSVSRGHLLQHSGGRELQEDLCFALWRPSTGTQRRTAIIDDIILPEPGERMLHGNASFAPHYLARAVKMARDKEAGLAFMHSHLSSGWQGMSDADVVAERDALAYPAGATGLPLVGMTIGTDGYWSTRVWDRDGVHMRRTWCDKTRVVGPGAYTMYFNDNLKPASSRRNSLRRTFDTWGQQAQDTISRCRIGIVGLGSVGCIVAEALARIGVSEVTLIDPDRVEEHNLDRLLYGSRQDIGKLKVELAARAMRRNATAERILITTLPIPLQSEMAYKAALDCDVLFSCVDRPVPRDVLNYIAQAHLIPVIDGGVAVQSDRRKDRLFAAHWRASLVTPYHRCLRCSGQYNSSMVVMELDGSLDDPTYITNLSPGEKVGAQNVFPFSLGAASMEINLMLHYLIADEWWPSVKQQDYQFMTGQMTTMADVCHPNCAFPQRRAKGDLENPSYLIPEPPVSRWRRMWQSLIGAFSPES